MRYYYIDAPFKRAGSGHEVTCTHVWRCTSGEDTITDPGEPGTPQGVGCCAGCGVEGEIIYRGLQ